MDGPRTQRVGMTSRGSEEEGTQRVGMTSRSGEEERKGREKVYKLEWQER